ncbi:hypothetical protein [Cellulophaga sp. Hel_I_12]|uniref:hypothetical protein n=1 Tax=Cellulophaga sp. Hel_I_12 TaxID=1249972 RepID=UPI000645BA23|nr:hypothetical protein [Cellulophaga sp. Hel_I_12]
MMKLVKQDIQNIDRWLEKKGIKYLDVRYELMDHLINEYESLDNYPDLNSFLKERLPWCKKVVKEKQKAIHWSYQKEVWKQFLNLFLNIKTLVLILFAILFYYVLYLFFEEELTYKGILIGSLFTISVFQFYKMISFGISLKKRKQLLSSIHLMQVFSFPNLFVYCVGVLQLDAFDNLYFFNAYIGIAMVSNVAALMAFEKIRKGILKDYQFLKVYLA